MASIAIWSELQVLGRLLIASSTRSCMMSRPASPHCCRPAAAKRDTGAKAAGGAPVQGAADATNFAHYADEGEGMSLSPATVLTMSLVFIGIVVLLHVFGKLSK